MKKQLLLALFIVAGLAAVFAFKQEHTSKKYLTLSYSPNNWITIVDEQGASQSLDIKDAIYKVTKEKYMETQQAPLTAKLNEIAAKGYRLVAVDDNNYIFEKE